MQIGESQTVKFKIQKLNKISFNTRTRMLDIYEKNFG